MALRSAHAILLCSSCLVGSAVVAQDRPVEEPRRVAHIVVVDSERCAAVSQDELGKLIALELAPRAVRSPDHPEARSGFPRASVRCSDAEARLYVADEARKRQETLTLDFTEIPSDARARLLALSLSELLATVELEAPPEAPREAPRAQRPTPPAPATPRVNRSRAWLGVGIAREGKPAMLMPSLQTGVMAAISRWPLGLQGELQLHRGERSVPAGDVVSWTVSGSLAVGGQLTASWIDLGAGLGLRLGYAHLRGDAGTNEAVMGRTVSGAWWAPTTYVSAVVPVQSRWGARFGLDLSYVARDVRGLDGTGASSYSFEGIQLQANIGVTLKLTEKQTPRQ